MKNESSKTNGINVRDLKKALGVKSNVKAGLPPSTPLPPIPVLPIDWHHPTGSTCVVCGLG